MHDPATSLYPDPASLLIGSKWVEATGHTIAAVAEADAADIGAVVSTLNSGQPADYASDVWYPQPALPDHPWRTIRYHGMTPHTGPRRSAAFRG